MIAGNTGKTRTIKTLRSVLSVFCPRLIRRFVRLAGVMPCFTSDRLLWSVGKYPQFLKVLERLLEKLVGLLDRDLRLPGLCLANGVEPSPKDFFSSDNREGLFYNGNVRDPFGVSRVAPKKLGQNVRVECFHSGTSASRCL
jgi:hypothetical protein